MSKTKSSMVLALMLSIALSTAARADDHELRVEFLSKNGHVRKVKLPVQASEASRLEAFPPAAEAHVIKARETYAAGLGYTRETHGSDAWKIVPGLRVLRVSLHAPGGRVTPIR